MNQPLSFVHPDAKIANNVVIEPFVNIEKNVHIDEGTWIGSNVTIMEGSRIGKNCKIFPGAVIGAIPQDLKFRGEETTVTIGDNTTIRECVTVNRGTIAKGETIVGSNCLLMAYVHVAHDCIIGNNVILVNGVSLAGEVIIDDWAIISANSLVHQFCHIGQHTMLAGNSLVGKDIPPYIKVARYPISYAGVNSIGLRRRNFCNEKINIIQDVYRVLFNSKMNTSQAIEYIETELPASKERDEIILFVRNSKRGILKGYFDKSEQ
ncbi:acyl-ACP--UDP-N-acetylglucosamine O-acyltransferase [Bacteroidales bacterium OttesenSCG-928-I21]|nr:acyl-ACP--UDP-N-acetylglucosamine O-acyltransferase [Bacteroidales bacterium OttesenSCG-928-I21]